MAKFKKIGKGIKAVVKGVRDYSRESKDINEEAERRAGRSLSRNVDIQRTGREIKKIKKERGSSVMKSIKKYL